MSNPATKQPSSSSSAPSPTPNIPLPPPKKTPPLPWSHIETVNLIEAYKEKWYSLKRGQLKASQWEEVANSVAARCGFKEVSKSATQCRHKMEKLRKRYRAEKQRSSPSLWVYFDLMDLMELGPYAISVRPIATSMPTPTQSSHYRQNYRNAQPLPPPSPSPSSSSSHDDGDDDEENDYDDWSNKSRSINRIIRRPPIASPVFDRVPMSLPPRRWNCTSSSIAGREGIGGSRYLRNPMFRKRKRMFEEEEEEEEEEVREEVGGRLFMELASVVRAFSEGFVKIENRKMEMMKEAERNRIEMEKKRMEMIHESQRRIVDAIAKTLGSHNPSKNTQET